MKWFNRLFLLLMALPVLFVIVFWGLNNKFPGDNLADMLEQQAAGRFGIPLQVSPIELEWQGFQIPELVLMRAAGWKFLPRGDLFISSSVIRDIHFFKILGWCLEFFLFFVLDR